MVDEAQAKLLPDITLKTMSVENYEQLPVIEYLTRKEGTYVMALGGQVSNEIIPMKGGIWACSVWLHVGPNTLIRRSN